MIVLGLLWLAILVVELVSGISPFFQVVSNAIWLAFGLEFLLRFTIAPEKWAYLKRNWLTLIALALPALRVLRAFRAFRALSAARGLRLARIVTSLNRGMRALGRSMSRRGLGYVVTLTAIVTAVGAAGMYAFERSGAEGGIESYADSLWWTAMLLTTIGSEYWPKTPEGRILAVLLSVYALGVLGYITGALASFFVGRDADAADGEIAGQRAIRALHEEVAALRAELARARVGEVPSGPPSPRSDDD